MQAKYKTSITHELSILLLGEAINLRLPHKPCDFNSGDSLVTKVGNDKLVLTYLVDDSSCDNPLESCDGEGMVYTANHRNSSAQDRRSMQEALGLDENWERNYGAEGSQVVLSEIVWRELNNSENTKLLGKLYRMARKYERGGLKSLITKSIMAFDSRYDDACTVFTRHFTNESFPHYLNETEGGAMFELGALAELQTDVAWDKAADRGLIGNPLSVMLDIYEHGGINYSLSGSRMNFDFDTTRGGAIWVPDEEAVINIKIQAAKKLGVEIVTTRIGCVGVKPEHNIPSILTVGDKTFSEWKSAADFALSKFENSVVLRAQQEIAREFAKGSVELYNDWCNGNCFGIVSAIYESVGNDNWEIREDDHSTFGYIGYQPALDEAKSSHEGTVKFLEKSI